ncbi:MAG: outer membrane protein transport protein [Rhodocyclales bacterium]|nr:outer membrane protein transport protein [Rhodocyclales bacterium]
MKLKKLAVSAALATASTMAFATDGYFAHGYGMKAKGMGGAATAMASDSMGGANNPASMVWAGDRFDIGVDFFSPKRKISRSGATAAGMNGEATSDSNLHYVPELGFNKMLGWDMSFGVTVYGNGGMNTDYPGDQNAGAGSTCAGFGATWARANLLCGNGRLGVDLMQVVVAPTFAMKINKQHSLGVSLLLAHQQFKASGIQSFAGFSETATNLSNLGRDKSNGVGLRLGWMGQLNDRVTMGAAYSPKTKMSKFDLYKGLFADGGVFDLPENWNVGVAFKPNDTWTVAADYQVINYGGVTSISNPSNNGGGTVANTLGGAGDRGFGWSNVDVIKLGVEYKYNNAVTVRAGYNHSKNPIQARDVTFNFLAPGVIKDHLTLGVTYNVSKDSELTLAYMHAFKNSVEGRSLFNDFGVAAGNDKIEMSQDSLGIAFGMKF